MDELKSLVAAAAIAWRSRDAASRRYEEAVAGLGDAEADARTADRAVHDYVAQMVSAAIDAAANA